MRTAARLWGVLATVAALMMALGAGLAAPRPALAHAEFISSSPAPGTAVSRAPAEVRIVFSEDVEPRFSSIRVWDTAGQRVESGSTQAEPADARVLKVALLALANGVYTVSWRALSVVDGHTTTGSFSFAVGPADLAAPPGPPTPVAGRLAVAPGEVLVRFLLFASAAAAGGAILFHYLVWAPALAAARLRERWNPAPDAVLRGAALMLLAAALGMAALRLSTAGPDALATTRAGLLLLVRVGLATAFLALSWWAPKSWSQRHDIALAALMGVLLTVTLNSHNAARGEAAAASITLDYVHLLAMAAWSGGLVSLLLFLGRGLSAFPERERPRLLAHLVPRFSLLASGAVALLIGTGVYSALTLERRPQALVSSAHGWSLTAKLVLVALVLGIAAVNLLVMRPRLGLHSGPRALGWQRWFRVLVGAETAGVVLVLLATGVLTTVSPPVGSVGGGGGLRSSLEVEGLRLALRISPGQVGLNRFQVELRDAGGRPVPAAQVLLKFSYQEQDLGESIAAAAAASAPGDFEAVGGFLGLPGTWTVKVAALPAAEAAFRLSLPTSGRASLVPAPTGAAVDAGRRLYGQYCARCHGIGGFGNGPDAAGLQPPVLNLNVHVPYHADQQLFRFISEGVPGTAMDAWKGTLREEDIWALVHYLRATFKEEEQ